jgi:hypothetical protein
VYGVPILCVLFLIIKSPCELELAVAGPHTATVCLFHFLLHILHLLLLLPLTTHDLRCRGRVAFNVRAPVVLPTPDRRELRSDIKSTEFVQLSVVTWLRFESS